MLSLMYLDTCLRVCVCVWVGVGGGGGGGGALLCHAKQWHDMS